MQAALERVNEAREEQEEQRPRGQGGMQHQPNTTTETRKLVAAYLHGTGAWFECVCVCVCVCACV